MTAAKALPADLIDSLLSGYKKLEDLIGENGLLKQFTKAFVGCRDGSTPRLGQDTGYDYESTHRNKSTA